MREKVVTRIEPNVTIIPKLEPLVRHKRVAAYVRVSTASDEQMGSIAAQRDYYSKYIAGNTQWVFVGIYADEGLSGTSSKRRPAFQQMVEDALAGKIDLILTKSLSRFARNTVDTLKTIRALKEKNVEVYFEKEDISTLDSKGEFLITLMSSLAQEERNKSFVCTTIRVTAAHLICWLLCCSSSRIISSMVPIPTHRTSSNPTGPVISCGIRPSTKHSLS